jgi:hypothetical protein
MVSTILYLYSVCFDLLGSCSSADQYLNRINPTQIITAFKFVYTYIMDGPGISAASDLRLLFSASTHFRSHLASSAQNKDITILIEAMCTAAQERLEQSTSPPSTTRLNHANLYSARLEENLNAEYHQDRSQGPPQPFDHTWNYTDGPMRNVQLGFSDGLNEFPGGLQGSDENPSYDYEQGQFH